MTKTEIRTTSGSIEGLSANTRSQKVEATSWSSRSVTVKVSSSPRSERVASINRRLHGGTSRNVSTSD